MCVYKRGNVWWYRFTWKAEAIRESTKQTNKRVAEQMEAAHKTSLAKGEVGLRDRQPAPTIRHFAEVDFLPSCRSGFGAKPNTLSYYERGVARLLEFAPLADESFDTVRADHIAAYARSRQDGVRAIATINRELQVLRRMFRLATEWEKVTRILPRVRLIPGEAHRDRVLTAAEAAAYLEAVQAIGTELIEAYQRALTGLRATVRGEEPIKPADPYRLRDAATILIDCALRPDECFRLRWENVRDDAVFIPCGKTPNARRVIPLTDRVLALLEMRRVVRSSDWVFPSPTKTGHVEKSTLKKQHAWACEIAKVPHFPLYTFRHTCITRWAEYMDPYTLAYLAGHSDFSTTRRYVHPQAATIRAAMERARLGQGRASVATGTYSVSNLPAA
jgi:integrase